MYYVKDFNELTTKDKLDFFNDVYRYYYGNEGERIVDYAFSIYGDSIDSWDNLAYYLEAETFKQLYNDIEQMIIDSEF